MCFVHRAETQGPTLLMDWRGGCNFPPEHLCESRSRCGCVTAEIQGTCSVDCVGTRIAPPPSRLEPQTQDARGVGSLACIAPDLVMNPKPGPSEKESVSDTRPLD